MLLGVTYGAIIHKKVLLEKGRRPSAVKCSRCELLHYNSQAWVSYWNYKVALCKYFLKMQGQIIRRSWAIPHVRISMSLTATRYCI